MRYPSGSSVHVNRMAAEIHVRKLSGASTDANSWRAVRELCCRTGDNGNPVAPERWDFFARVWIEPYEKIIPEWTYIAEVDRKITGYLTGCPNTARFTKAKRRCTIPLLIAIMLGRYRGVSGTGAFARRELGAAANPESYFAPAVKASLEHNYPAHLHVNVDGYHRGFGVGRRLVEHYLLDLERTGVPGVHLICGAAPLGFYRRLEFREVGTAHGGGTSIFLMGRKSK